MNFNPATGEVYGEPGPAETPGDDRPESFEDEFPPPPEDDDSPAADEAPEFDFKLWARDAAELVGEILGRKVSTAEFRRMVMVGNAPKPSEGSEQWSQAELEKALAAKKAPTASGAGIDFELFARDAAELAGEHLGIRLTAGGFRQLVIDGDAPAPIPGTDRWSQKSLMEWVARRLSVAEASAEGGAEDSEKEPKPVHRDVFDFWDRTFSVYYELFDTTPNAIHRNRPVLTWCRKWWLHRGVVGRVTAAWFAWEAAHAEGGAAISAWILEHADRHFDRIMAEDGPLRECKGEHTDALDIYPTDPAPESVRTPTEDEGEME